MADPGSNLNPRGSVQRMTERLLTGAMASEEFEHFESILLNDPAARLTYIEHVNVHAQLSYLTGAVESIEGEVFIEHEERSHRRKRALQWMTAVTACCVMIGGYVAFQSLQDRQEPNPLAEQREADAPVVGFVVNEGPEDLSNTGSQAIASNRPLKVTSGLQLLRLINGVTTAVHSSTQVQFKSPAEAVLERGTFLAHVPPKAVGFTVETPHLRVVDLGTTFGVAVSDDDKSELRVFAGSVSVQSKINNAYGDPFIVKAGEVIQFASTGPVEGGSSASESEEMVFGLQRLCGIRELKGAVKLLPQPPRSIRPDGLESDQFIQLIQEQPFVVLDRAVKVVPPTPGTISGPGNVEEIELPQGTRCSSLLLHCDLDHLGHPLQGSVRFNRRILGIIYTSDGLQNSDPVFARPEIEYPSPEDVFRDGMSRGCITPFGGKGEVIDEVTFHDDGYGITATLSSPGGNVDQLRILLENSEQ